MSEENIAIRLKFLIDNLGISSSQFADKCDIARPTLSQLLSGRNKKISNLIIEHIHASYPNLSILWLLFGEGDMWSSNFAGGKGNPENNDEENSDIQSMGADNMRSDNAEGPASNINQAKGTSHSQKNPCEIMENPAEGKDERIYSKENGVNDDKITSVNSNNENVNGGFCTPEILTQIAKIKEKPRKVVQITVYYDDSTFQTFYPNK